MTELERLNEWCTEKNCTLGGITTAYSLGLSEGPGTAEELAAEINRINKHLENPVNNEIALLEGQIMMKTDTLYCLRNQVEVINEEPFFVKIPLTGLEQIRADILAAELVILKGRLTKLKEDLDA